MIVKTNIGEISYTNAGVVFVEEDYNLGKELDAEYDNFSKSELFWGIYQRIIIPSREKMGVGNSEDSLRLFHIYEKEDSLILYFHFDDIDEAEFWISNGVHMLLDDAIEEVYHQIKKAIADIDFVDDIILVENEIVVPSENEVLQDIGKYIFYQGWI